MPHRSAQRRRAGVLVVVWLGLVGSLVVYGFVGDAFSLIATVAKSFFAGAEIIPEPYLPGAIPTFVNLLAAEILVMLGCAVLLGLLLRREPQFSAGMETAFPQSTRRLLVMVAGIALVEEVLLRWFPLSAVAAFLPNASIRGIAITAAVVSALLHRGNFRRGGRIFALPHFMGALFSSYIYLRWGLMAAVVQHFTYDALLLLGFRWGDALRDTAGLPSDPIA